MQVSLKEARRIERRTEAVVMTGIEFGSQVSIYEDIAIDFRVEEARIKTEKDVLTSLALTDARCFIRRAIQAENEVSGINALIARREQLTREGAIWINVIHASSTVHSVDALRKMVAVKIERSKSASASMYAGREENVNFSTISETLTETAKTEKFAIQKAIDKCDDKLAALNANSTIEIPSDIVDLLKENNII